MKKQILIFIAFLISLGVYAQEEISLEPLRTQQKDQKSQPTLDEAFYITNIPESGEYRLSSLSQKERDKLNAETKPPTIGVVRKLENPINLDYEDFNPNSANQNEARKVIGDSVLVLTYYIESPEAKSIKINIEKQSNIPPNINFFIYNKDKQFFGPYKPSKVDEDGYWTPALSSNHAYFQIRIPVNTKLPKDVSVKVNKISHIKVSLKEKTLNLKALKSLSCYEDVNCSLANDYSNINYLKKSVALFESTYGGTTKIGSGALLNNMNKDGQPLFLTANHVINSDGAAENSTFYFDYRTTSCNSGSHSTTVRNGANLLSTGEETDYTLLLIGGDEKLEDRTYLGMTTEDVSTGDILHSVGHPEGKKQKYIKLKSKTYATTCTPSGSLDGWSFSEHHYAKVLAGAPNSGASGSPLVRNDGKVVGQYRGRCATFTNVDLCDYSSYKTVWGEMEDTYPHISKWIEGNAKAGISANPTSWDFGTIQDDDTKSKTFTFENTYSNGLNLDIYNIKITGTHSDQFSKDNSSLYIQPDESDQILVEFQPTSGGTKNATLEIYHNGSNTSSPLEIPLSGTEEEYIDISNCPTSNMNSSSG
ncbi:MAG: choice-of-anchor D domain-containing protein, partial [bacterium]